MIVTIDGPAGAGKSTVARELAQRLGFRFLDTGAMYRVVALAGLRRGVNWEHPEELVELARRLRIDFDDRRVLLDGEDVSETIRSSEVTALIRYAADNPEVRRLLVARQREWARFGDLVTEGRDQGTVAFPDAECKIFLTASPEERARRRLRDLEQQGETASLADLLARQNRRDHEDRTRAVGGLVRADGALEVWTDGMSLDEVVRRLEDLVRQRQAEFAPRHPGS